MRLSLRRYIVTALIVAAATMYSAVAVAQINTEQVLNIGRNALYFDDYILAIQYLIRL